MSICRTFKIAKVQMFAWQFSHDLDLRYFFFPFCHPAISGGVQIRDLKCERNWVQKSHCDLGAPGFYGGGAGAGALLSWLFESTEANSPLLRLLQCCLEAVEIEKRIPFNAFLHDAFWVFKGLDSGNRKKKYSAVLVSLRTWQPHRLSSAI